MNFELKFNSAKGDFTLNVDHVAVLDRCKIPFAYIVPQESTITTTDQAAIQCISQHLLCAPLSRTEETEDALLVEANGTRWILFGRKEANDAGVAVMKIKARIIGGHALGGWTRPQLEDGQSAFLTKKVRSVLDEHQKSRKKRKLSSEVSRAQAVSANDQQVIDHSVIPSTSIPRRVGKEKESDSRGAATKRKAAEKPVRPAKVPSLATEESTIDIDNAAMLLPDKAMRDKLKKMIVTLLSLRGVTKKSESFKDLYQHTLQAATFALRQTSTADLVVWEERAMSVNEALLKVFLKDQ